MTKRAGYCKRSQRILEAAGYRVTLATGSLSDWDLIGLNAGGMVLIRISEEDWPDERTRDSLCDQLMPWATSKLLHRWTVGRPWPEVRVLP